MSVEKFKVMQTGSPLRRHRKQRQTLIGLGRNRIGQVAEVPKSAGYQVTASMMKRGERPC